MTNKGALFRSLPGVDTILETINGSKEADSLIKNIGDNKTVVREILVRAIRKALTVIREQINDGTITNIVTNARIVELAKTQIDKSLRELANILYGSEDTVVVKDMHGAIKLVLKAISDHPVLLMPSMDLIYRKNTGYVENMIMDAGATIVEIGCTNRVHLKDLETKLKKCTPTTINAIFLCNKSNTETLGFTKELDTIKTTKLAKSYLIPLIIIDFDGTNIKQYLSAGVDVVVSGIEKRTEALVCGNNLFINEIKALDIFKGISASPDLNFLPFICA